MTKSEMMEKSLEIAHRGERLAMSANFQTASFYATLALTYATLAAGMEGPVWTLEDQ